MELPPPKDGQTFAYMNDKGQIEVIDVRTGKILAIQTTREELLVKKPEEFVEYTLESGDKVLVEKNVSAPDLSTNRRLPYSPLVVDLICQKIAEGQSLTSVCRNPGFPSYALLCRWRRENPGINDMLNEARRDRAEQIHDRIMDEVVADAQAVTKDDIPGVKLKFDALKWLTQVGDQDRYGQKQQISGKVDVKTAIVVDTGIRRPGDEGYREIEERDNGEGDLLVHDAGSTAASGSGGDSTETLCDTGRNLGESGDD